jgi:hypothetical protein
VSSQYTLSGGSTASTAATAVAAAHNTTLQQYTNSNKQVKLHHQYLFHLLMPAIVTVS